MDLEGKAALVTGGGVGAGRAIALALSRRGCKVAVSYSKSQAEADLTAADIEALGTTGLAVRADVRDDDQVREATARVVGAFGGLDILVNNAGVTEFIAHDDLDSVTDEVWQRLLGTNVIGAFSSIRAAAPALKAGAGGCVINISSIAGVYSIGSSVPYCASKAALNSMTVSLARALAPEIRINAVAPGYIDTRWWQGRDNYAPIKQMAEQATPLKKVCQPEDVAGVVVGLIDAETVTGQILVVDGGYGIAAALPS